MTARAFDAVVFDFGGVIITPITDKVADLARRHGVTMEVLLEVLMGPRHASTDHPWHRAERGEVPVAELQGLVAPYAAAAGIALDGDEMAVLFDQSYRYHDHVLARIDTLRTEGYRTGLLTNSVREFRPTLEAQLGLSRFDVVVDSSEVGARKPEPAIYERTTERLGTDPARIVYLDDFEQNVAAARTAGWTAIHVVDVDASMRQLDALVGQNRPTSDHGGRIRP